MLWIVFIYTNYIILSTHVKKKAQHAVPCRVPACL